MPTLVFLFLMYKYFFSVSNWKCFKAGFISKLVIWGHRLHFLSEKYIFEKLNPVVTFLVWSKCHKSRSISCGYSDTICTRMSERKSLRAKLQLPHLSITSQRNALWSKRHLPQYISSWRESHPPSVWFPNQRRSVYSTILSHAYTPTCARINQVSHAPDWKYPAHAQIHLNATFN